MCIAHVTDRITGKRRACKFAPKAGHPFCATHLKDWARRTIRVMPQDAVPMHLRFVRFA